MPLNCVCEYVCVLMCGCMRARMIQTLSIETFGKWVSVLANTFVSAETHQFQFITLHFKNTFFSFRCYFLFDESTLRTKIPTKPNQTKKKRKQTAKRKKKERKMPARLPSSDHVCVAQDCQIQTSHYRLNHTYTVIHNFRMVCWSPTDFCSVVRAALFEPEVAEPLMVLLIAWPLFG